MLLSETFDRRWSQLMTLWKSFQVSHQFYWTPLRLGTSNRPACIGHWIQRGSLNYRPAIANLAEFASKFLAWWTVVKRKCRVPTNGSTLVTA